MNGVIIAAIICGTVIILSLIDKIGKNKCKNCKHIKNITVSGCISNDAKKEIENIAKMQVEKFASDIESLFR